jgi:hypothetical protein
MSLPEVGGIPKAVQKAEEVLTWLIQNVWRGTWFRRSVFLLVVFATFASPPVASSVLSAVGAHLPMWYSAAYWTTCADNPHHRSKVDPAAAPKYTI